MAKNKTILIVDDDVDLLNMLKVFLLNENYKVIMAGNGRAAKDIIEPHDLDLIIADVKMPEVDGFSLTKWVRGKGHHEKILLMSGFTELLNIKHAHRIGADDFIVKPLQQKELHQKLDVLFNSSSFETKGESGHVQEYSKVAMNIFLRHENSPCPIYLKLNDTKTIKIADAGVELDDDRNSSFIDKGIKHLYLTKEDFKTHTSRYIQIASAVGDKVGVPIEKKQNYMLHIGDVILNKVYS